MSQSRIICIPRACGGVPLVVLAGTNSCRIPRLCRRRDESDKLKAAVVGGAESSIPH